MKKSEIDLKGETWEAVISEGKITLYGENSKPIISESAKVVHVGIETNTLEEFPVVLTVYNLSNVHLYDVIRVTITEGDVAYVMTHPSKRSQEH